MVRKLDQGDNPVTFKESITHDHSPLTTLYTIVYTSIQYLQTLI